MSLVLYSSTDEDEEIDRTTSHKRFKYGITVTESYRAPPFHFRQQLPPVNIQLANEIDLSEKDFTTQQNDRSRLFAHERGNWALSVFALGTISFSILYSN